MYVGICSRRVLSRKNETNNPSCPPFNAINYDTVCDMEQSCTVPNLPPWSGRLVSGAPHTHTHTPMRNITISKYYTSHPVVSCAQPTHTRTPFVASSTERERWGMEIGDGDEWRQSVRLFTHTLYHTLKHVCVCVDDTSTCAQFRLVWNGWLPGMT